MTRDTVLLTLALLSASSASAVVPTGTVHGTLRDEQGAPIAGVTVVAVNDATKFTQQAVSDVRGEYELQLGVGTYTITAWTPGFKRHAVKGVVLGKGATLQVDMVLEVADQVETIMVRAVGSASRVSYNTETYDRIDEIGFRDPKKHPLSTFSVDVDTASYANVRRFLRDGAQPPADAVRIEELLNYFEYSYPSPRGDVPFSVTTELGRCPWASDHRLLLIGLQGREIEMGQRPPANLVFLIDVSGSMDEPDKLPLLVDGLKLLVRHLNADDRVALVVYAGASGLVLPSTSCRDQKAILDALDALEAGGSTHGSAGIQLAYEQAQKGFIKGGINRVILATDGDFNVGVTDVGDLTRLIEEKRESGVFLSVLGFGTGNLKDATMEKLADRGNGNYSYIDSVLEARKVLVDQAAGTLVTIAKDVKIQVEFNPARVSAYGLIGYENRMLDEEAFEDDRKDAGEIGAGHSVTALYEIVPGGGPKPEGDGGLRYQRDRGLSEAAGSGELAAVKLRYKLPDESVSRLLSFVVKDEKSGTGPLPPNLGFAAAVAEFGMLLRDSEHKGQATFEQALALAREYKGEDPRGYRSELIQLVELAATLE